MELFKFISLQRSDPVTRNACSNGLITRNHQNGFGIDFCVVKQLFNSLSRAILVATNVSYPVMQLEKRYEQ